MVFVLGLKLSRTDVLAENLSAIYLRDTQGIRSPAQLWGGKSPRGAGMCITKAFFSFTRSTFEPILFFFFFFLGISSPLGVFIGRTTMCGNGDPVG